MEIFLGIDPGLATVGFGVIQKEGNQLRHVGHGTIRTPSALPAGERLRLIKTDLVSLFQEYNPCSVGIEKLFFSQNTKTALQVAEARGVIVETVFSHHLPFFEMTPLQIKNDVCGDGGADKIQIQRMVKQLLSLASPPRSDDAADALAIAIYTSRVYKAKNI
ncbi:crossover junction endodeoxyribonuclease RuvC [Candidatus Peregrinibacteria bacterium]|nr:crossover junction endodeoxyribonuclease RuvC [Candidatus Peregrinibacteria bacterium]